jgi:hypothetical protein
MRQIKDKSIKKSGFEIRRIMRVVIEKMFKLSQLATCSWSRMLRLYVQKYCTVKNVFKYGFDLKGINVKGQTNVDTTHIFK